MPIDRFNLRHLRAFCQIAECGSISAASDKVYLSQPAITQAIAKLETSLGTRLFMRKNTGMLLTEAGKILHHRVKRTLETLANGALGNLENLMGGECFGRGFEAHATPRRIASRLTVYSEICSQQSKRL